MRRISAIAILVGLALPVRADKPEETPFKTMTSGFMMAGAASGLEFEFVPNLSSCLECIEGEVRAPAPYCEFPEQLTRTLASPESVDHAAALECVEWYAACARNAGYANGVPDLDALIRRTFEPHSKAMEAALIKSMDSPNPQIRLHAALDALCFRKDNAKALEILERVFAKEAPELRVHALVKIGMMHLANPELVEILKRSLDGESEAERNLAANAVHLIGPEAKATLPALIRYLETGKAVGELLSFEFESRPVSANLALAAISELKSEGRGAIPAILRRFPKADAKERKEMIVCLAKIGGGSREPIPLLEETLKGEDAELKVAAAFALLCFEPEHGDALRTVTEALKGENKTPEATFWICVDLAPQSKPLIALLVSLLDSEDTDTVRLAALALGKIGPSAAVAVPKLERSLMREDRGNFLDYSAAAYALGRMGAAGLPSLLRAKRLTKLESRRDCEALEYSVWALGSLGRDVPPEVLDRLVQLLLSKSDKNHIARYAARSLGRLGENARRVRPLLVKHRDDERVGFLVEMALAQIPE